MKLVVQIIDKHSKNIERHTLKARGLSIGRAWDNDIIVQDKFVDADHMQLKVGESGQIEVNDIDSTNGTVVAGKRVRGAAYPYRLGDPIRIGDTTVKVFDASIAVEKTALRSVWFYLQEHFRSLPALAFLTAVALTAALLDVGLFSATPYKWSDGVVSIAGLIMFLLIWSLVFGLVSKLVRGESNIKAHWALACFTLVIITVLGFVLSVIRFNLQQFTVGQLLNTVVMGLLAVIVLYAIMTYTTFFSAKTKALCSILIIGAVISLVYSDELLKEEHERWSDGSKTEQVTFPPVLLLRSGVTLDQYVRATDQLFVSTDIADLALNQKDAVNQRDAVIQSQKD